MLCAIPTVANSVLLKVLPPQQSVLLGAYAGCLSGDRGRVSARGPGRSSVRGQMESLRSGADEECAWGGRWRISSRGRGRNSIRGTMKGVLSGASAGSPFGEARQALCPGADAGCPFGSLSRVFSRGPMRGLRPGADAIALHEIHLARQSSLQVPVGHISVPGGIKLCSPGTFGVANYLIINNSSCQVNFMKPNRATIRYTNSQWLRVDTTEVLVGRVAVPKCR